jgi:hypothetical protein
MTFDPDPQKVIPQTVAGAMNALEAAYAEPSVRRFVLTSSSTAAILSPNPAGTKVHAGTWNEKAVRAAGTDTTLPVQEQALLAYSAAKTRAEQMIWDFHKKNQEKRPDLAVNTSKHHFFKSSEHCILWLTWKFFPMSHLEKSWILLIKDIRRRPDSLRCCGIVKTVAGSIKYLHVCIRSYLL